MSELEPSARDRARQHLYATRPTRLTLFLRTNLLWQLWRFVLINLKMIRIIAKSHETHIAKSEPTSARSLPGPSEARPK